MVIIRVSRGVYSQYDTPLKVGGLWDFENVGYINSNPDGIHVELSAVQPRSRILVNNHIEFDTVVNFFQTGITISGGSGQARGSLGNFVTNKLYKLESGLKVKFNSTEGELEYRWYDKLAGVFRGTTGGSRIGGSYALAGFTLTADQTVNGGVVNFDTIIPEPAGTPLITLFATGVAKVLAGHAYVVTAQIAFDAQTGNGIAVNWGVEESLNGTTGWTPVGLRARSTSANTNTNVDDTPVTECIRGEVLSVDKYYRIAYTVVGGTFQQIDFDVSRMIIETTGGDSNLNDQQNAIVVIDPASTLDMELRIVTALNVEEINNQESYALVTQL